MAVLDLATALVPLVRTAEDLCALCNCILLLYESAGWVRQVLEGRRVLNLSLASDCVLRRLFDHPLLHSCLVVLAADIVGDLGSTTAVSPLSLALEGGAKVDEAAIAIPCHATHLAPIVLVTCVIDSRDSIRHLALLGGGLSLTLSLRVEVIALLDG